MSIVESLDLIQRWLQKEDDELLYDADIRGIGCDDMIPTPPEPPIPGAEDMGSRASPRSVCFTTDEAHGSAVQIEEQERNA